MSEYKYPYVPKNYYPAVLQACKYIRDTGWFDKAINYYASRYNLDAEELAKHVRARQAAGQKASKTKRKYFYFAVEFSMGNERNGGAYFEKIEAQYKIVKATSARNAEAQLSKNDDYASEYSPVHWFGRTQAANTKEEAAAIVKMWEAENGR